VNSIGLDAFRKGVVKKSLPLLLIAASGGWWCGCSGKSSSGANGQATGDVELVAAAGTNGEEGVVITSNAQPTVEFSATIDESVSEPAVERAIEPAAPPSISPAEVEALKAEVERSRQAEVDRQAALKILNEKIAGLESDLATARSATEKGASDLKAAQAESEQLKTENERLKQLDFVEYARLVELTKTSPDDAVKAWPLFIEKFPLSSLNKKAQEQFQEAQRQARDAWERKFGGRAIYTDRAPLERP